MKHKALNFSFFLLVSAILLLSFNGCDKANDDRLSGVWVLIDIGNVNNPHQMEWSFLDSYITVFKVSKSNPSDQVVIGKGSYLLKTKLSKATLIIVDFELYGHEYYEYNMEWKVNKMTDTQMIISGRKDGGLEYKEFTKKQ